MSHDLQRAISALVSDEWSVTGQSRVGGGCISDAYQVQVTGPDGKTSRLFVKSNDATFLDNFEAECDGLTRLAETGAIRVPEPLAVGHVANQAWLIIRWIDQASRSTDFFERFGRALAQMHRCTSGHQIGLPRDNYLGAASQINQSTATWTEFVANHRIGYQVQWASDQGLADRELVSDCEAIIARLDELLAGRPNSTCLLHGDLWSGNYLCDSQGFPVILDPAVYYGCPEAEFGMLRLFGSCPTDFYESYEQESPLNAGWQRRVSVYVLYHLLNHLNLFGRGYYDQCRSLAKEILRG